MLLTPYQVWVCVMFAALNIDRNNISNAVSDNMLDDLGLTRADYVSRVPSRPASHRTGVPRQGRLMVLTRGLEPWANDSSSRLPSS